MKTLTFPAFNRSLNCITMAAAYCASGMQWGPLVIFTNPILTIYRENHAAPLWGPLRPHHSGNGARLTVHPLLMAFILSVIKAIRAVYGHHFPADYLDFSRSDPG